MHIFGFLVWLRFDLVCGGSSPVFMFPGWPNVLLLPEAPRCTECVPFRLVAVAEVPQPLLILIIDIFCLRVLLEKNQ